MKLSSLSKVRIQNILAHHYYAGLLLSDLKLTEDEKIEPQPRLTPANLQLQTTNVLPLLHDAASNKPVLSKQVLDLTESSAPCAYVAADGELTFVKQSDSVNVIEGKIDIIRSNRDCNVILASSATELDMSKAEGVNVLVPGADNQIFLGLGKDNIGVKPNQGAITIHNFGPEDSIHILGPTSIISEDGKHLCHDTVRNNQPVAIIEAGKDRSTYH